MAFFEIHRPFVPVPAKPAPTLSLRRTRGRTPVSVWLRKSAETRLAQGPRAASPTERNPGDER